MVDPDGLAFTVGAREIYDHTCKLRVQRGGVAQTNSTCSCVQCTATFPLSIRNLSLSLGAHRINPLKHLGNRRPILVERQKSRKLKPEQLTIAELIRVDSSGRCCLGLNVDDHVYKFIEALGPCYIQLGCIKVFVGFFEDGGVGGDAHGVEKGKREKGAEALGRQNGQDLSCFSSSVDVAC
jgi:hypothetical protein